MHECVYDYQTCFFFLVNTNAFFFDNFKHNMLNRLEMWKQTYDTKCIHAVLYLHIRRQTRLKNHAAPSPACSTCGLGCFFFDVWCGTLSSFVYYLLRCLAWCGTVSSLAYYYYYIFRRVSFRCSGWCCLHIILYVYSTYMMPHMNAFPRARANASAALCLLSNTHDLTLGSMFHFHPTHTINEDAFVCMQRPGKCNTNM